MEWCELSFSKIFESLRKFFLYFLCLQADSADAESTQAQFDQAYQKLKIQIQDAIVQQVIMLSLVSCDRILSVEVLGCRRLPRREFARGSSKRCLNS